MTICKYVQVSNPIDPTFEALFHKPHHVQLPVFIHLHKLEIELAVQLWDHLCHLQHANVLAQTRTGSGTKLSEKSDLGQLMKKRQTYS